MEDLAVETKRTVIELIEDLRREIFTKKQEEEDLGKVEIYFTLLHPEKIIYHVIDHVLSHKDKIEKRDVNFFLENKSIFAGLPEKKIEYYSRIIAVGDRISKEDREVIWEYFDSLIALAESYKKNK